MLATGGSAIKAIEVLIDKGVKEENIIFLNIISCPEGITAMVQRYVDKKEYVSKDNMYSKKMSV